MRDAVKRLVTAARVALLWCVKGFVWLLTAQDRRMQNDLDRLRALPGFEDAAEEAARLDKAQGGRRNMHRVLDRYGLPDARWFK